MAAVMVAALALHPRPAAAQSDAGPCPSDPDRCLLIEDFEGFQAGDTPYTWTTNIRGGTLVPANGGRMTEGHKYIIEEEYGNKFARATMTDYAYRLIRLNGEPVEWDIRKYPVVRWQWRVHDIPEGAREDERSRNDTAAAFYVTFSKDWLGRPRSIKYTYSSTLPVGTRLSHGQLKVIVVASALEDPLGEWMTVERDVAADYRSFFDGKEPNPTPLGITLFSDSDDLDELAIADFDNVMVLSGR